MRFYRVENELGHGPYQSGLCRPHLYDAAHPSPEASGLPKYQFDNYYGFTNKQDLKNWFRKSDINLFKSEGFDVWEYQVKSSDVIAGHKQAVMKRDKAFNRRKVTVH